MDNLSEALLMAGGVFIAILVISVFVMTLNNVAIIQGSELSKEEAQRLAKWNAEWEAYNKKLLYDTEVLTVLNKAKQNNTDYYGNSDIQNMNVQVYASNGTQISEDDVKISVQNKQNKIFTCEEMKYNDETGRIENIKFKIVE